ncbi:MAG: integrase [Pseudomonadota bacterium]|nr:integrase [Pseudomonadota bacterium]
MALVMSKLYAALRLAGVPDDNAISASEEVAGFENRLASVESRWNLLTWMVGFNVALTAAVVVKLFAV